MSKTSWCWDDGNTLNNVYRLDFIVDNLPSGKLSISKFPSDFMAVLKKMSATLLDVDEKTSHALSITMLDVDSKILSNELSTVMVEFSGK